MFKYKILKNRKNFMFIDYGLPPHKGSREKRVVADFQKAKIRIGFFKYEKYNCTEACSEKLSYEIAKVLKINSAKIEFAKDESGTLGIISYLFNTREKPHTDAKAFFNANDFERKTFCTVNSIKNFLDRFGEKEFETFIEMMVFDALIGETDRHEENWGLLRISQDKYTMSPLYDTGCNLLRQFKDEKFAKQFYEKKKSLEEYAAKSQTCIYKENGSRYRHFELIKRLLQDYPQITKEKIYKIKKLKNWKIMIILNRLPKGIITDMHKKYIYEYLKIRKRKLLELIQEGGK